MRALGRMRALGCSWRSCRVCWCAGSRGGLLGFKPARSPPYTPPPGSLLCGRPVHSMAIEGYDLVMLGILAAAAMLGYFKGIVWQLAWIAGIAASAAVALRFGGPLAPLSGNPSGQRNGVAEPRTRFRCAWLSKTWSK